MPLERGVDPRKIKRGFQVNPEPIRVGDRGSQAVVEGLFLLRYKRTKHGGMVGIWLPANVPIAQEYDLNDPAQLERFVNPPEDGSDHIREKRYRMSTGGDRSIVFVDIYRLALISKEPGLMAFDVTSPYPPQEGVSFERSSDDPIKVLERVMRGIR